MRRTSRALAVAGSLLMAAAAAPPAAATAAPPGYRPVVLYAVAQPDADGTRGAYTYDATLAPAGAGVAVLSVSSARTRTVLAVRGLLPNRTYGAHLHVNPCGAKPTDAGGHFQQRPDPVQPSVDDDYANPVNEVWLDVTTDAAGRGIAVARNPWRFRAAPRALVLHAEGTHTDDGHAGMAGARVACVTLAVRR